MRILNKRFAIDCLWVIYIAFVFLALDGFKVKDHFNAIGGGHLFVQGIGGVFAEQHFLPLLFIAQYVLAIYLIYISTRITLTVGFFFLFLLWVAMMVDLAFQDVVRRSATVIDIALFNSEAWRVPAIVSEYIVSLVVQIGLSALLFLPVIHKQMNDTRRERRFHWFIWPLLLMYGLYAGVYLYKGESALAGYPKGYSYGYATISVQLNQFARQMQTPDPFEVKQIAEPVIDKIIVVIDHAVSYDAFVASGANQLPHVIDYGQAFSGANCSSAANFVLRKAGWLRNGTDQITVRHIESLLSLATKANYKIAYMDNRQVLDDVFTGNYMDTSERLQIQYNVQGEGPLYERDLASIEEMPGLLGHQKVFLLINKVGLPFPYADTLAPQAASGRKLYNYKKSLEVNTKGYLEKLTHAIDNNTLVFYTSDHGQYLEGPLPACNTGKETRRAEYMVPFLVITKHEGVTKKLAAQKQRYMNKLTHLEFSESVRNMMGYAVDGMDSIVKPPRHLHNIYCGLYGPPHPVLGHNPACRGLR